MGLVLVAVVGRQDSAAGSLKGLELVAQARGFSNRASPNYRVV
jgi:hypothetical protein